MSLVLNERGSSIPQGTRQRVIDAARELGYHAHHSARGLAGGKSQTVALVLRQSGEQIAGDALLAEVLRGLSTAARGEQFRVLVEPLTPGNSTYGELLRSAQADGLVVSGPIFEDPDLRALVAEGFPVVIHGNVPGLTAPSIDIDNIASARAAVEHLIELGHRRIACITNAPFTYTAAADRVAGYRDALEAAGLPIDDDLIAEGAYDAASGHRAMNLVLGRAQPDSVFVASDVVALGAIGALRGAGLRVPDDVSIVGFDDIPLAAYFDPPLTTIRVPAHDLGLAAGTALLDVIAGRTVALRTLLATRLVVRSSTAGRPT